MGKGSCTEAPASSARLVCRAWPHTSENGHCQMDLVPGDFLVCRWVGKGLGQTPEITMPWKRERRHQGASSPELLHMKLLELRLYLSSGTLGPQPRARGLMSEGMFPAWLCRPMKTGLTANRSLSLFCVTWIFLSF